MINAWLAVIPRQFQAGDVKDTAVTETLKTYMLALNAFYGGVGGIGAVVDALKAVTKGPLTTEFLGTVHQELVDAGIMTEEILALTQQVVDAYNSSL